MSTGIDKCIHRERWADMVEVADIAGLSRIGVHLHPDILYTTKGRPSFLPGMYSGGCFLVGNGPGLLAHDISLLGRPGVCTYTMNNGIATLYQRGISPTFWGCVDSPDRFIRQVWFNPGLIKFVPGAMLDMKLWDNEDWKALPLKPLNCPNVHTFARDEQFEAGKFFRGPEVNWGCCAKLGGGRSVMLAALRILVLLGFKDIYLVGVDLDMRKEEPYHFQEGRVDRAIANNTRTFNRLAKEYLPAIVAEAKSIGVGIWTCKEGGRTAFLPYMQFSDAVGKCQRDAGGPFDSIQTAGLYVKPSRKARYTREVAVKEAYGS